MTSFACDCSGKPWGAGPLSWDSRGRSRSQPRPQGGAAHRTGSAPASEALRPSAKQELETVFKAHGQGTTRLLPGHRKAKRFELSENKECGRSSTASGALVWAKGYQP